MSPAAEVKLHVSFLCGPTHTSVSVSDAPVFSAACSAGGSDRVFSMAESTARDHPDERPAPPFLKPPFSEPFPFPRLMTRYMLCVSHVLGFGLFFGGFPVVSGVGWWWGRSKGQLCL